MAVAAECRAIVDADRLLANMVVGCVFSRSLVAFSRDVEGAGGFLPSSHARVHARPGFRLRQVRMSRDATVAVRGRDPLTRVYATLSSVNEAIVRVRERLPLFEEVCRLIVDTGRLRMVWVGEVDDCGWIVPVASAGATRGYLDSIRISVSDVPEGRGPTGVAAREGHHVVMSDISADRSMAPWREAALARGYRSSAAFPLMTDGRCGAVLTAYAAEKRYFDHEELELFDRMAADLGFALEAMQRENRRRALEAQFRTSEEQFRVAAELMLDSLAVLAPVHDSGGAIVDFRHVYVNDAYCALTGFARERLIDHRLGDSFPQFPGSNRFDVYRRVATTREPCRSEDVHDEPAWVGSGLVARVLDVTIAPLGDDRLMVSARDVTGRRHSEQELRLRAELLDLAHDAVIVRDPIAGRVTIWNREAEAIYGYSRAEAIGCVAHELLATVFPRSGDAVAEALARDGRWAGELLHRRRDGGLIVVASRQALQRDEDGRATAIIELNSDITERKRTEEQLVRTTGLLERTQQVSRTGGWEYNLDTEELTWTAETYRIYGLEPAAGPVDVARAVAFYDRESAPIIADAFARLVSKGVPYDLELGLIRADGRRVWVRTVGRPVLEGGRIARVGGHIADVTDRRCVEEELRTLNNELEQRVASRTADLEHANEELETFAYSVSHDLRAPLRAVDGFSQALLEDYGDRLDEEGRHYLERVRAGAVRMGKLIDEILQLSRLSRQPFVLAPVDMSALASEVAGELEQAEPGRTVEVEIEQGVLAQADPVLVRCVLENLIGNAFKFTSKAADPRVRFGAVQQNGVPVYFVSDNGAGFDMSYAKGQLFRPFHRLHRTSEFDGEGIGLATVVRAVHRHGGQVWAEGAVDRGATFSFTLRPGTQAPTTAATGEDTVPVWQPRQGAGRDER